MSEVSFVFEVKVIPEARTSQYHDRHTISRLIGAAPGYVGFEEGGEHFPFPSCVIRAPS